MSPQDEGGYHVYAPDLPGLHTQGGDIDDAMANANEAVALYVEGLREDGARQRRDPPLDSLAGVSPRQPVVSGERLIKVLRKEGWDTTPARQTRLYGGHRLGALAHPVCQVRFRWRDRG